MFNRSRALGLMILMLSALVLSGCGGSDIESGTNNLLTCDAPNVPDESGTTCVPPPPIQCTPPTVPNEANDACVVGADPTLPDPVFFPSDDQAVLYYNRAAAGATNTSDAEYDGWRLHTWSNDACDAYADPDTEWANGRIHDGIDPNYGAYWILDLKPGYAGTAGSCHNFIVHIGTDDAGKDPGPDQNGPLDQDDARFARMNFVLTGETTVFEFPIISLGEQPVEIDGMGAHWLDANTIVSAIDMDGIESMKLHYSAAADLEATLEDGLNGTVIDLEMVTLTDEQAAIAPHLAGFPAFQGDWTADDAKAVMKTQVALAGYDAEGKLIAATGVQLANGLDQVYTTGEDDANEAMLGGVYTEAGGITAAVWAPTARNVRLLRYNDDKTLASALNMTENTASGVWSYEGDMSLDRTLYRYEVTVYHPVTGQIEVLEVTDPYSVSLSTNGRFSRFVNLNDEDLKPEGWDTHEIPLVANPEDIVIYEGHIRDFSVRDESVSEANRGKYLAFTEDGSVPVEYLRGMAEAGVTHFHMLPANDIATIEEDVSRTVDFSSTVGELCILNRDASVCEEADSSMTLGDLYASYDPIQEPTKAQQLLSDMRGFDQFNWGYDPHHFNAPEGSYASSPEGVERIIEMRAMNQALHGLGLRVALDVVYNHTNASGVFSKSVLDKVVPGYYHRYEVDSGSIVRETCCDDTEPRNVMFEKFMEDSLVLWTEQYKFDSFRFDIMSQASKDTMVRLRDAVQAIDPDNYFYGEGWTRIDRGYEQANQLNMAGTEIGTFNDRIREAIRQGQFFNEEDEGAALDAQDRIKSALAGTLSDYVLETSGGVATTTSSLGGYAQDPADIINYVSKHDNETLWDQFNYTLPQDLTLEERVRAQNIGIGLPIVAQGIPFLQMGGDMLRSKSMDRNTFDAGDWFNYVDFTMNTNNWNVGLPLAQDNEGRWGEMATFIYSPERAATMTEIEFASEVFKELLQIRSNSPLFRLTDAQDIINRLGFHNIGSRQQSGLILMSLDDGVTPDSDIMLADIDANYDAIVVAINSGTEDKSIRVNTATGFELHMMQMNSIDPVVRNASFEEGVDGDEGNGLFNVPAMTIAVFVKPQMGDQGYGLSAYATSGAPDIVPYGDTVVYLRGGMNGWGTDDPMAYKGDGVYSVEVNLTAGEEVQFKVADADWSTPNLGAPDGEPTGVTEDETKVVANSNNNLVFTPDTTTSYKFTIDASDLDEVLLTVSKADPFFDNPVFLRGGMNGWGTDNPFSFQGDGLYTVAIDMDAGTYDFKVATDDWSTVNLGAVSADEADRRVDLEEAVQLAPTNDNLFIEIADAESYVFAWDNAAVDNPLLRVFKEEFLGSEPVYVRGGMNGWGTDDQLVYQGDGVYSVDIALSAGTVEFKVASDDWSTVNLGAPDGQPTDVSIGTAFLMATSNNNMRIETDAATFRFEVTGPVRGAPAVTVTQQ